MKRLFALLVLTLTLTMAACSTPDPAGPTASPLPPLPTQAASPSGDLVRTDEQGAVVVEITPLNLTDGSEQLEFEVGLNTHSVDLRMDLAALSTLSTDTGFALQATAWEAPLGGHHVAGKLIFPAMKDGKPVLEGASWLKLTVINLDAPSRVFEWDLR